QRGLPAVAGICIYRSSDFAELHKFIPNLCYLYVFTMSDTKLQSQRKRVLSGMRPTGRLHIGHYFGALSNWLKMQNARLADGSPEFDSFHFVADWHALTTHYADSSQVAANTLEVATDWLAVGLDPQKVTLFIQSAVPEHAELHLLLSMITPLSWLERVPTYKEQIENLRDKDLGTYGFLGYPLLQSADIVMYGEPGKQLLVPVGEDQAPHIEMTREVVRRCNLLYGIELPEAQLRGAQGFQQAAVSWGNIVSGLGITGLTFSMSDFPLDNDRWADYSSRVRKRILEIGLDNVSRVASAVGIQFNEVLQEPDVILTETPRVPGTDGR